MLTRPRLAMQKPDCQNPAFISALSTQADNGIFRAAQLNPAMQTAPPKPKLIWLTRANLTAAIRSRRSLTRLARQN
jgi:hypothetical protein